MKPESTDPEYLFFTGCMARLKLPQVERSVRLLLTDLGIGVKDEPRFTCCPDPVVFRSASRPEWLSLAARNLSLDSGHPIVTLCPGCASSLCEARHILISNQQAAERVAAKLKQLDLNLEIPEIVHFLKILSSPALTEEIKRRVSRSFEGRKIGCHYGCHLVRPSDAVGFDDPEKPTSLDELISLAGAESVDYEDKYLCCGRPSIDESISAAVVEHKLRSMKDAGCEMLVVACPFCFEQFDLGQVILERKKKLEFGMPVLYISQLLGLAMGKTPADMGLDLHRISLKGLL